MLIYRKYHLRIALLWYADPEPSGGVDVAIFHQAAAPLPGVPCDEKMTLILDLTQPEEALFAQIKKTERAKIRNCRENDHLQCVIEDRPDLRQRNRFYDFFDRFAQAKGIETLDRLAMDQMALQGELTLSWVREAQMPEEADPLVFHAYFVYRGRARALYSASQRLVERDPERLNLIGRANRLLHWDDIRHFRAEGLQIYDFGGWYSGSEDRQKLSINQFKRGFGGTTVTEYEAIRGLTLRGKAGVFVWNLLRGNR
jgi:hypothetical protein